MRVILLRTTDHAAIERMRFLHVDRDDDRLVHLGRDHLAHLRGAAGLLLGCRVGDGFRHYFFPAFAVDFLPAVFFFELVFFALTFAWLSAFGEVALWVVVAGPWMPSSY